MFHNVLSPFVLSYETIKTKAQANCLPCLSTSMYCANCLSVQGLSHHHGLLEIPSKNPHGDFLGLLEESDQSTFHQHEMRDKDAYMPDLQKPAAVESGNQELMLNQLVKIIYLGSIYMYSCCMQLHDTKEF